MGTQFVKPDKCNKTIEELRELRNPEGAIVITNDIVTLTKESKEPVGNQERIKNWIELPDGSTHLLKSFDMKGSVFAELVTAELAKQAGFQAAEYDYIKIGDKYGVMSKNMLKQGQTLSSLYDYTGNPPEDECPYPDVTGYSFVSRTFEEKLLSSGLPEDKVSSLLTEFRKRMLFSFVTVDQDKHPENFSFITNYDNSGIPNLEFAPVFDNESAFILDTELETIQKYVPNQDEVDIGKIGNLVETINHPKIANLVPESEGGYNSLLLDTMETIYDEDPDLMDYFEELYDTLNLDDAMKAVEEKIHAPIPYEYKNFMIGIFSKSKELMLDFTFPQEELGPDPLTALFKSAQTTNPIRTSEQNDLMAQLQAIMNRSKTTDIDKESPGKDDDTLIDDK